MGFESPYFSYAVLTTDVNPLTVEDQANEFLTAQHFEISFGVVATSVAISLDLFHRIVNQIIDFHFIVNRCWPELFEHMNIANMWELLE